MPRLRFPPDFLWGAATSAYQIEGAVDADGRGRSIWDEFCERPGAIANGESGRVACDHYNRWAQDLDIIRALGIKAYRFSIAWPRILPEGTGRVNPKGLDFYSRLVDGLLERGIEPFVTLYHWDLPSALEKRGGWRVRATAEAFAKYAELVAKHLGDRVRFWITLNEIPCIVELGHRTGEHAPGAHEPEKVVRQVNHNLLLAHGLGVMAIRSAARKAAQISLAHIANAPEPFTENEADIEEARRRFDEQNAWILDPIFKGAYPEEIWRRLGKDVPDVAPGDLEIIAQPIDYLGINIYSSWAIARAGAGLREPEPHYPRTYMDWPIMPDCLYWGARFVYERYEPAAIYITENGCAWPDAPNGDGEVEDYARVAYLCAHLRGVHRAISEAIPLRGFFVWSLLDNFEWAHGYAKRFGIVYVDYQTLERRPKLSAQWYSRLIAEGAI